MKYFGDAFFLHSFIYKESQSFSKLLYAYSHNIVSNLQFNKCIFHETSNDVTQNTWTSKVLVCKKVMNVVNHLPP